MSPWIDRDLPFAASSSPLAQSASLAGVANVQARASNQTLRYLELLAKRGPTTDAEAAAILGLMRSTINARRVPLRDRGIVKAVDSVKNEETGVMNVRWGLVG